MLSSRRGSGRHAWVRCIRCLELHHDAVVHEKIESCFADSFLLVLHGNRCLAGESDAAECQLDTQCFFIDGFQKARAEMPMHFDRRPDHSMHKGVERCARFLPPDFPGDLGVLYVPQNAEAERESTPCTSPVASWSERPSPSEGRCTETKPTKIRTGARDKLGSFARLDQVGEVATKGSDHVRRNRCFKGSSRCRCGS